MNITLFGIKVNLEVLILICVVYLILFTHTVCGCTNIPKAIEGIENMMENIMDSNNCDKQKIMEGFNSSESKNNVDNEDEDEDSKEPESYNGDYSKYMTAQPALINADNELITLFKDTPFKPECCPSTYTNSSGCVCLADLTPEQEKQLVNRGNNFVDKY
jgi:hypothetical protein